MINTPILIGSETFSILQLTYPVFLMVLIGYFICEKILSNKLISLAIPILKAAIFFTYFFFFYDGTYTSGADDEYYLLKGQELLTAIYENEILSINLINISESFHFFYIIISSVAQCIFGSFYFSLVAINVITTFFCSLIAYRIIFLFTNNVYQSKLFFIVFLFEPELLSWSSIFAGKDTFVLLGHLIFIYGFLNLIKNNLKKGFTISLFSIIYMINLRFYVVLFYIALLFFMFKKKIALYLSLIFLGIISFYLDLFNTFYSLFETGASYISLQLIYLPLDILHFWLTPRPFYEDAIHGFLLYADIFNWLSIPFIIYGFFTSIFSNNLFNRYIAFYYISFSIFYGLVDYLNGPRHRVQLLFATVFFLWIGLSRFKILPIKYRFKIA